MAKTTRLAKSLVRLFLPIFLIIASAVIGGSVWLVYSGSRPLPAPYLVRPEKYGQLSTRAATITEETWSNRDGTTARAWLLRGSENAPAVVLLHKFGADRSYVLNLGVKLNESTNFTILMPDARGHGEAPLVENASFGGCEAEDLAAAIGFLRELRTPNGIALVGADLGVYGVEMGALTALTLTASEPSIRAVALDSVPAASDTVLTSSVKRLYPFAGFVTEPLSRLGTHFYYFDGCYKRDASCDTARRIEGRDLLLLAGVDADEHRDPTAKLARCFPDSNRIETKTDLSPSGFSITNASMEKSETYEQRLIDFFRGALGTN
jgi:pimeloyl-ACP methyl ester carboxylesterase